MICPCSGNAYVDSFDWPGKPRQWFLRCEKCGGMSDAVETQEAAALLTIRQEQAALAAPEVTALLGAPEVK